LGERRKGMGEGSGNVETPTFTSDRSIKNGHLSKQVPFALLDAMEGGGKTW
jgi:hypothetical protein